jgi:hypothetical protein
MELLVRFPSGAKAHLYVICYGASNDAPFQNVSYCATSSDSVSCPDSGVRLDSVSCPDSVVRLGCVVPRPLDLDFVLITCKSSRFGASS